MSDTTAAAVAVPPPPNPTPAPTTAKGPTLWAHGSFSFKDFLDIINPLQHLPVIGSVYRYLTGDEPSGGARIVGDTIYGGPIGFGVGVVSTMLTDGDGRDLGERTLAAVFGKRDDTGKPVAVAQAPSASGAAIAQAQAPNTQPAPVAATPTPAASGSTALATQLYRSPPTPVTPEQNFLAQNAQFQRQLTGPRPEAGQAPNSRPVPLELTGNPLPNFQPKPIPLAKTAAPPQTQAQAQTQKSSAPVTPGPGQATDGPVTNPIAQKMLEALDKYERMKKQQDQYDSGKDSVPSGVDLAL